MKILLALILLLLFPSEGFAQVINCNQFWTYLNGKPYLCEAYTPSELPAKIGSSTIKIFHYSKSWSNDTQLIAEQ